MTTPLPEAAVEAAFDALVNHSISVDLNDSVNPTVCRCGERFPSLLEYRAHVARAALTAARPHMEAETVWEGPFTDPTALDNATREGDVVVDDVGTYRQRRYPNSVMGGGYTSHGCGPLTASDLLENGKRPAWVLRAKSPAATIAERTNDDTA